MNARRFRISSWLSTALLVALAAMTVNARQSPDGVEVMHLRGPVYMISAGGANITASIGPDGVLLADTGPANVSEKVLAAIGDVQRQLRVARSVTPPPAGGAETRSATQAVLFNTATPPDPVRFIFNTNAHADHNGGNPGLAIAIPKELSFQDPSEKATRVFAHENVLQRLSGASGGEAVPYALWPSETYSAAIYKLTSYFNGEGVQLMHIPAANTDGDSFVWFRTSDVVSAGDIYRTDAYPTPDLKMGGNIQGVIEGLNQLLDLAIPEYRQEGGTLIVPGHGRVSDSGDVAGYRDMVTIIRDRVERLIEQGKTLDQVKAARPSMDYDSRYARQPGSADRFIEAVYQSLRQ